MVDSTRKEIPPAEWGSNKTNFSPYMLQVVAAIAFKN